jgi:hypothetical protein
LHRAFSGEKPEPIVAQWVAFRTQPQGTQSLVQNDRFCAPAVTETSAIAERSSIAGAQNSIDLRAPQTRFALQCV